MIPPRLSLPVCGSLFLLGGVLPFLSTGCDDNHSSSSSNLGGVATFEHDDVVLRDRLGQAIDAGSTEPYSPRETCGQCHWVDFIANGYHFQQGRTDAAGAMVAQNDYFQDGRNYIRSAGMYGKW